MSSAVASSHSDSSCSITSLNSRKAECLAQILAVIIRCFGPLWTIITEQTGRQVELLPDIQQQLIWNAVLLPRANGPESGNSRIESQNPKRVLRLRRLMILSSLTENV